jgi:hypothetical protein
MASRPRHSSRSDRDSDSMEALKPLVVLVLFGTILYGAYSVVQKGPSTTDGANQAATEAPPFAPPAVEVATAVPTVPAQAAPPAASGPLPLATAPAMSPPTPLAAAPAPPAVSAPVAAAALPAFPPPPAPPAVAAAPAAPPAPLATAIPSPAITPSSPPPPLPVEPPPAALQTATVAAVAAGAGAALGAAAAEAVRPSPSAPTYLTAESAPPPAQDSLPLAPPPTAAAADRPDRYATLSTTPPPPASPLPGGVAPPPSSAATGSSAAFATAWADAHEKLAAGRYAEALAALSIWYDDPSLGLEESQRLEDLLGQLAGTVIYSQQDLLLPPHVVAAGETLPAIAMQLRVSWQLLGKINGVDDPQRLMPGEHLKLIRGPFDAVVSVSRRRISLQLAGNFAGSFPVVVGRQFLARVGSSIPVAELRRGSGRDMQAAALAGADAAAKPSIVLADGLVIEAAEDPGMASDTSPATSLVVSVRDLAELLDILGPGSNVLIRQ